MKNAFIDIEVRVNYDMARQYLLGWDGLLRDLLRLGGGFFLLLLSVSLQVGLPCGFPELPLYPAVWLCGYMFSTGGPFRFLWPIVGGLCLDGASFGHCGESSLLLMLSSALFALLYGLLQTKKLSDVWALGLCSGAATFVWGLSKALFCVDCDGVGRLKLMYTVLPFAVILGMLGGGLMLCCLKCLSRLRQAIKRNKSR